MKAITISSFTGFCSRGSEALLRVRTESIRKLVPQVKFYVLTVYTETCRPIKGVEYIKTFGARREKFRSLKYFIATLVKAISWTFSAWTYRFFNYCPNKSVKKLSSSEIFISSDGDVLGEDYGFFPLLWRMYFLSLGIVMKKPVFIYAAGPGPFKSRLGKAISRFLFKRCIYISVREKGSLDHLAGLGIDKKKIDLVADSAFLLKPAAKNLNYRRKGKKLIGVAVSELVSAYGFPPKEGKNPYVSFVDFMAGLIDWIIENLNADIIMVAHAIQAKRDDYQTAQDIFKRIKNKNKVKILSKSFGAADYKKAISHCDLMIASRLHAAIAALSSFVPAIGIAYSHKMDGIYRSLGVGDLVIDIKTCDGRIKTKIKKALADSNLIKRKLRAKMPLVKKLAEKPAFELARILKERTKGS
ncbi:MAG: polysaccharide pyruvyl transferase family protein [Candidatus Shapirobacteria bacterium]